jgi:effector-binding domain-containing protein
MVSYAFPALSVLASRMEGVGNRVREEELALYVRRKDVVSVVKELDSKTLENSIGKMYQRLEKHFSSAEDQDLDLVCVCVSLICKIKSVLRITYKFIVFVILYV